MLHFFSGDCRSWFELEDCRTLVTMLMEVVGILFELPS